MALGWLSGQSSICIFVFVFAIKASPHPFVLTFIRTIKQLPGHLVLFQTCFNHHFSSSWENDILRLWLFSNLFSRLKAKRLSQGMPRISWEAKARQTRKIYKPNIPTFVLALILDRKMKWFGIKSLYFGFNYNWME